MPTYIIPSYLPGISLISSTPRTQIPFTVFLYCSEETSICLLKCITGSYVCILVEGEPQVNWELCLTPLFSLVHNRSKCMFSNKLIKEGTNKCKCKHAVLILSSLLEMRLTSSFISSNKPLKCFRSQCSGTLKREHLFWSMGHSSAFKCSLLDLCESCPPKDGTHRKLNQTLVLTVFLHSLHT